MFILTPGLAALQVVCSKFDTTDFQSNRTEFTVQLKAKLQQRCDLFKCEINDVQVNDIRRPSQYEAAIREKQAAVENIQVRFISVNIESLMYLPMFTLYHWVMLH